MIYCWQCQYLQFRRHDFPSHWVCNEPKNLIQTNHHIWLDNEIKKYWKHHPRKLNKYNDCKYYKKKIHKR